MKITPRLRLLMRLRSAFIWCLWTIAIGALAWSSTRYVLQADWTASGRNTLSSASQILLERLEGPVRITSYARENHSLRSAIEVMIARYQRYKPDLELIFVDPDEAPEQVRELGIMLDGEMNLEYRGRSQRLQELNEQAISNALLSLSRRQDRKIVFISGHGERKPKGQANQDLGTFGRELERTGFTLAELNLVEQMGISEDTIVLVLASPQVALLSGEVELIQDYVERGGNLLWLVEPGVDLGLQPLSDVLHVEPLPGVIVDADTSRLGIDNPAIIPIVDYGLHPISVDMKTLTLFPIAAALEVQSMENWSLQPLMSTQTRTWTETSPLSGDIRFDADSDERSGPLTPGLALFRPRPGGKQDGQNLVAAEQRVVVIGDGDFLSNSYLGNGGNLSFGLNIVNWLSEDDKLLDIHLKSALDRSLELSDTELAVIAVTFLFGLPGVLLCSGWLIWWRRRRRR